MKLPLKLKINLRDHEADKEKNLQEIAAAMGGEGDWTADIENPIEFNEAVGGNKVFTICYKQLLGALKDNLVKATKDEIYKEALIEALHKKTIIIKWEEKPEWFTGRGYFQKAMIEDGALVVSCAGKDANANISRVGENILEELPPSTHLAQNEADEREHKTKNLQAIADILELEKPWTLEIKDPLVFSEVLGNNSMTNKKKFKVYTVCYKDMLKGLKDNLEKLAKDELIKEALAESINGVVIQCAAQDTPQKDRYTYEINDDEALVITCSREYPGFNTHEVGNKLMDLLE